MSDHYMHRAEPYPFHIARCLLIIPFLGLIALLSHCYLESNERIGGDEAIFDDAHLPGLWKASGESKYFLILKTKSGDYTFQLFDATLEADGEAYAGKATKVGNHTFLNVQRLPLNEENPRAQRYIPVYYSARNDKLMITLFNTDFFDKAIAEKKLAGEASIRKDFSSTPTRLIGKGAEIGKYIAAHAGEKGMYEGKQTHFERMKLE